MYKFTGFTQKANDVLNAAIEYAENMGHTYIGSEHLLLGLLTQNGGNVDMPRMEKIMAAAPPARSRMPSETASALACRRC